MPAAPAPASRTPARARLYRKLKPLARAKPPFDEPLPPDERGVNKPVWVEPKLVAEVNFHGWTHGDRVRQASFQGLREDKAAKDVVREVKAAGRQTKAPAKRSARRQNAQCRHASAR